MAVELRLRRGQRHGHCIRSRRAGPREDGGFKPSIVAPGAAVSSRRRSGRTAGPSPAPTPCRPATSMLNGTSMAAPQTVGGAALLISAYKATHGAQRPTAAALRNAIMSERGVPVKPGRLRAGHGPPLRSRRMDAAQRRPAPHAVSGHGAGLARSSAACSPRPNVGVGIHDREGVVLGQALRPDVHDHPDDRPQRRPIAHNAHVARQRRHVRGRGGKSDKVTLPLNIPVLVDVGINPADHAGVHSAILELDDPPPSASTTWR